MAKKSHHIPKPKKPLSADKNGREIHVGDIVIEDNGIIGRVVAVDREGVLFRAFKGQEYVLNGETVGDACENCTVLDELRNREKTT